MIFNKNIYWILSIVIVIFTISGCTVAQKSDSQELKALTTELTKTNQYREILLLRDLVREFQSDDPQSPYRKIYMSIDRCEPLYTSWGGKYNFREINKYLGLMDELGFYREKGVLSQESIEEGFGYVLIEAWEYPEMQRYIRGIQENAKENTAFDKFESLVKSLEQEPKNAEFVRHIRTQYTTCYGH